VTGGPRKGCSGRQRTRKEDWRFRNLEDIIRGASYIFVDESAGGFARPCQNIRIEESMC